MNKPSVTEEMVERALVVLDGVFYCADQSVVVRRMLEAALAVQPKPEPMKLTEEERKFVRYARENDPETVGAQLLAIIDRLTGTSERP